MAKWSLREREGVGTPSLEEFFWFHMFPGGTYRTATAEGGLESEEYQYYLGSGLIWFGSMAYALNAIEAAAALGATNIAAEWAVWRNLQIIQMTGMIAPFLVAAGLSTAAGTYLGVQAVTRSGIVPQTLEIAQGRASKPWWMPMAVYVHLYS